MERIHPVGRKGKAIGSGLRGLLLVRTRGVLEQQCSEYGQRTSGSSVTFPAAREVSNVFCADTVQQTLTTAVTLEQVSLRLKVLNLLVLPPVVGVPKFLLKPDSGSCEFKRWGFGTRAMAPGLG